MKFMYYNDYSHVKYYPSFHLQAQSRLSPHNSCPFLQGLRSAAWPQQLQDNCCVQISGAEGHLIFGIWGVCVSDPMGILSTAFVKRGFMERFLKCLLILLFLSQIRLFFVALEVSWVVGSLSFNDLHAPLREAVSQRGMNSTHCSKVKGTWVQILARCALGQVSVSAPQFPHH